MNTSDVPITAFVLAVTVTDSNGPSEGGLIRDFLNHAVFFGALQRNRGSLQSRGTESIPARGTYDEKIGVAADFRDFAATLTVVAFADKTASAVSPEALQQLTDNAQGQCRRHSQRNRNHQRERERNRGRGKHSEIQ